MSANLRIRIFILLVAICLLIAMASDAAPKTRLVQTDYCFITYRGAAKDPQGVMHFGWAQGYAPCNQLDRYENT
jgi:hypothetical protein